MSVHLHRPAGSRHRRVRQGDDSGQATVEFALTLPVLLIVVLGLVQVGVAVRNELAVELAAREGARAASVTSNAARSASAAATSAVSLPIVVSTSPQGSVVTVTVTYVDPTNVPIIGRFLGPTTHTASVTMALEPP